MVHLTWRLFFTLTSIINTDSLKLACVCVPLVHDVLVFVGPQRRHTSAIELQLFCTVFGHHGEKCRNRIYVQILLKGAYECML